MAINGTNRELSSGVEGTKSEPRGHRRNSASHHDGDRSRACCGLRLPSEHNLQVDGGPGSRQAQVC
jgi:hypothetical protein